MTWQYLTVPDRLRNIILSSPPCTEESSRSQSSVCRQAGSHGADIIGRGGGEREEGGRRLVGDTPPPDNSLTQARPEVPWLPTKHKHGKQDGSKQGQKPSRGERKPLSLLHWHTILLLHYMDFSFLISKIFFTFLLRWPDQRMYIHLHCT